VLAMGWETGPPRTGGENRGVAGKGGLRGTGSRRARIDSFRFSRLWKRDVFTDNTGKQSWAEVLLLVRSKALADRGSEVWRQLAYGRERRLVEQISVLELEIG
jgi:hypothetical protein